MEISEYTTKRAEALNKLKLPETELPINIKILWFDTVTSYDINNRVNLETHSHSFFEIHFTFSGKVQYECGGSLTELCGNQALFITPDTPHKYIKCSEDLLKVSLAFSFDKNKAVSTLFSNIKTKKLNFSNDISENVNFVLKQSEKKDFLIPGIISGRIIEIIYSVFNTLQISLPQTSDKNFDSRILVAKEYIKNNKHRIITCKDVAKECCLSSKQLSRIFKSYTGVSIFEYIIDQRIKYSKKLLLQSEHSIKEISFMLGFENECSFVSFFKRHCGMPPGNFRKQNSENNN
ncbi:MAG: helix-turn-helix transcriptional regulator [Clostridia bacterium]|nr:helix-turn-helix transcriptional regulator [Clostridia bacterium]